MLVFAAGRNPSHPRSHAKLLLGAGDRSNYAHCDDAA